MISVRKYSLPCLQDQHLSEIQIAPVSRLHASSCKMFWSTTTASKEHKENLGAKICCPSLMKKNHWAVTKCGWMWLVFYFCGGGMCFFLWFFLTFTSLNLFYRSGSHPKQQRRIDTENLIQKGDQRHSTCRGPWKALRWAPCQADNL